jgi:hypothetical protein
MVLGVGYLCFSYMCAGHLVAYNSDSWIKFQMLSFDTFKLSGWRRVYLLLSKELLYVFTYLSVFLRGCKTTLLKTPTAERKPDTCQIVAFSWSKRRAGYNGEEKFTRKTNSKTVPYKFHSTSARWPGSSTGSKILWHLPANNSPSYKT